MLLKAEKQFKSRKVEGIYKRTVLIQIYPMVRGRGQRTQWHFAYPAISVTVVTNFFPFHRVLNCSGMGNSLKSPPSVGMRTFISEDLALTISQSKEFLLR